MKAVPQKPPRKISSAVDLARIISSLPDGHRFLFRGQNVNLPPLPRLAREAQKLNLTAEQVLNIEQVMLDRFRHESMPFLQGVRPATDFDWLSLAQHHGLPTRLLDWTAHALAALWFAVANDPPQDVSEGVVWVLKVAQKNEVKPDQLTKVFELKRTYVFQPFHIDRRIAAQAGWFSIHWYSEGPNKFFSLDRIRTFKDSLEGYAVPKKQFNKIRKELRLLGVTEATLFPDLSGLSAEIQAESLGSLRPTPTI